MTPLSEYQEQCIVADYLRKRWPNVLWTATAGGVRLSIGAATKLKRMGLNRGVPDLLIFEPLVIPADMGTSVFCPGLAIEMKVQKGGVVSPEQKQWRKALTDRGWEALVCHGADEAIAAIEEYLK